MSDLPPPSAPQDLPPPRPPSPPEPPVVPPADTAPHLDTPPPAEGADPEASSPDDKTLGLVMYLLPLLGLFSMFVATVVPAGAILAPLVLWVLKKDQSRYIDAAGKEVMNFNICVVVCFFALRILRFVASYIYLGWLFSLVALLLWIVWIVSTVLSALTAKDGKFYRFPFSYRLIN